jgi:transposase-like protein
MDTEEMHERVGIAVVHETVRRAALLAVDITATIVLDPRGH